MNSDNLQTMAEILVNKVVYVTFIMITVAFLALSIKSIASSILIYLKVKFDEIGVGVIIEVDGKQWRVQKIRFGYVQLLCLEEGIEGVVRRINLSKWIELDKILYYYGTPKRRKGD